MRTSYFQVRLDSPRGTLPGNRPGVLRKLAGAAIGAVVLVGAFMLSVVVLAIVAAAGVIAGGWLWWRTRELRRRVAEQMRAREQQREQAQGRVIEGEVIRNPD
jgi:hypothetical protein